MRAHALLVAALLIGCSDEPRPLGKHGQQCLSDRDCESGMCLQIGDIGQCFGPDIDQCIDVADDPERSDVCNNVPAFVTFCGISGLPHSICIKPNDPLFTADEFGGAQYFCCKEKETP